MISSRPGALHVEEEEVPAFSGSSSSRHPFGLKTRLKTLHGSTAIEVTKSYE